MRRKINHGTCPLRGIVARYRPAKYAGDADLFLVEAAIHGEPSFWKRITLGRLRVHHVSGNHITLIDRNHAKQFALVLKQAIDKAEAAVRT